MYVNVPSGRASIPNDELDQQVDQKFDLTDD